MQLAAGAGLAFAKNAVGEHFQPAGWDGDLPPTGFQRAIYHEMNEMNEMDATIAMTDTNEITEEFVFVLLDLFVF